MISSLNPTPNRTPNRSPRASFVMVYGKDTDVQAFRDATFSSPGVFITLDVANQRPIGK